MQTLHRIRRSVATILLVVFLPACYSWKVVPISPVVTEQHPPKIRVTTTGGQRMELRTPSVVGDTLWGSRFQNARRENGTVMPKPEEQVAIPRADVLRVEIRKLSTGKTIGLSALGAVVLAAVALEIFCNPQASDWPDMFKFECTR